MALDTHIPDSDIYVASMALPMVDKLFFVDKVRANVYLDYGCADGAMLARMAELLPGATLVGYDESEDMIERARRRFPHGEVILTSNWREAREAVDTLTSQGARSCILLSSVVHEVYHYQGADGVEEFWGRVWGGAPGESGFDTVSIRDMAVARSTSRPADPLAVARVRQLYDPRKLAQWEGQWGNLGENWSLAHFLLTYRYEENWERELRENYLPLSTEAFLTMVPKAWKPTYIEHFVPPFLRHKVSEDFGIVLADPTHFKLIVERSC